MSSNKNSGSKGSKSSLASLMIGSNTSSQKIQPLVPPVLRDVGKLAAGVASVSTSTGSATGNPRNKCALQPGHSLMDWIRLGSSGRDLTGVGHQAGRLSVTPKELAMHDKETDAWIAIRGRVYNVTHYLPFHPGGREELMKGAGKDATTMFDQVHPWVNYEQILQKCVVGKLVAIEPSIDQEALFFGKPTTPSPKFTKPESPSPKNFKPPSIPSPPRVVVSPDPVHEPAIPEKEPPVVKTGSTSKTAETPEEPILLPRFDWIQKLDYITVIFYTKALCNPFIEVLPPNSENVSNISITYDNSVYLTQLTFLKPVEWPCEIKINSETGKIEMIYKKVETGIWENYGRMQQSCQCLELRNGDVKYNFIVAKNVMINHNNFLIELNRTDGSKILVPIGKHVKVYGHVDGEEISRCYTAVPSCLFKKFTLHTKTTDSVCLLVKCYNQGRMCRFITESQVGDLFYLSRPLGNFELSNLVKRETFLLLAAGTGITPMFSLILFLLERRIKKCQFIRLLYYNRTEQDIIYKKDFDDLTRLDLRFKVEHILSEADDNWRGLRGMLEPTPITAALDEHMENTGYQLRDIYCCICGSYPFNELARSIITDIGFKDDQVHIFMG